MDALIQLCAYLTSDPFSRWMMTKDATDCSFITAYVTEWSTVLVAGLVLMTSVGNSFV